MPHNTVLTIRFKRLNKPTVMISDGIFDFSNATKNIMHSKYKCTQFHPIIQDHFICIGEREKKYFSSINSSKVVNYMPLRIINKSTPLVLPEKKRILVTTANTAYFNAFEFECLVSLIIDIVRVLKLKGVDFDFRIFDGELIDEINSKLEFTVENITSGRFEDIISLYSSVITTPSSIVISSMFHQRSVGILGYRSEPQLLNSGWFFSNANIFEYDFDSFVNLDKKRMLFQKGLLSTYLEENDLSSILRDISTDKHTNCIQFNNVDNNLLNMLNSMFNINFEWYCRKIYNKFKRNKLLSILSKKVK
ncbi:hypothetical protein AB4138_15970 [Vibrio sp. 10N.286.52.C3]|uniref:hypothetical protein n=1 Tax=Vibrio sp. 10N.286.52.C3 TaxID=3229713 RepID=UPI00354CA292